MGGWFNYIIFVDIIIKLWPKLDAGLTNHTNQTVLAIEEYTVLGRVSATMLLYQLWYIESTIPQPKWLSGSITECFII